MMTAGLQDDPDAKNILDFALSSSGSACSQKLLSAFGYPQSPTNPNTVYSYVRANCSACHGSSQVPKFAVADGQSSYNTSLPYVNFMNPSASIFYSRSRDGHCGGACSQDGVAMLNAITAWAKAETDAKVDPACSGTGIKLRANGSLSDLLSASQSVNACVGYEIVSISNGVVANPSADLDIILSGAAVYSNANCSTAIAGSVKLLKTQSSVMIYVMEPVAGMKSLMGAVTGSSVKIDLTFTNVVVPTPIPTNTPMPTPTPTRAPTPTPGGPTVTPTPTPTVTPTPSPTPAGVACTTLQRQNAYKNTLWPVVKSNCATCHTTGSRPQFGNANLATAYSIALPRINITTTSSSLIYTKSKDGHCGGSCSSSMGVTVLNQINAWVPAEKATNCSTLGTLVQ